ncbi:hypothetical protein ACGFSB_08315 [Streptomyces sp. NPDC048441]
MPIDPYAALHALLRAEAVRNAPSPDPAPAPTPAPAETDDQEKNEH